jgi:type IV secretory pathway TrbD component
MPWYQVISTMITIILGTIAFGSLTMGYFLCPTNIVEWVICAAATLILFFPHMILGITGIDVPTFLVDASGIGLWVLVYFMQKIRIRRDPTLILPIEERQKLKKEKSTAAKANAR